MYAKVQLRFAGGFAYEDAWIPAEHAQIGHSISVVDEEKVWGCTVMMIYPLLLQSNSILGEKQYKEVIPF